MVKNPHSTQRLWVLGRRKLWGNYGDVLISGYARRETDDGPLFLHRTGPFLPPISFPWITDTSGRALVVFKELKQKLEVLKLAGVRFRDAAKTRIIPLAWERWNLGAPHPATRPEGGEPENYIWDEPHDAACAAKMSEAFELVPLAGPVAVKRMENPTGGYLDEFSASAPVGDVPPISRSHPKFGEFIVSDEMKAWFEAHAAEWLRFLPVRLVADKLR